MTDIVKSIYESEQSVAMASHLTEPKILRIILEDQLPSGKTSGTEIGYRKNGSRYMRPSDRFVAWRNKAEKEILLQRHGWPTALKMALPLRVPLVMTVSYRPFDNRTRDVPGMVDALFHLLEHVGLVENDGLIQGLLWAYPWRTEGPGAIFTLEPAIDPVKD